MQGTVFLDYDGTVHDCMRVYGPAFRAGYAWLVDHGYRAPAAFEDAEIAQWLGWTIPAMWGAFAPDLPESVWSKASHVIGTTMDKLAEQGKGGLFDGIGEQLDTLKNAGLTLVFFSNCRSSYAENHRRYYGLDRWFSHYICAEEYGDLPKSAIYRQLAEQDAKRAAPQFPLPHVMAGDRFHDLQVGLENGIPTVGCRYGYGKPGELDRATAFAATPQGLSAAVLSLYSSSNEDSGAPC